MIVVTAFYIFLANIWMCVREAFKKKKSMEFSILGSDGGAPSMENFSMYFFSETRPLLGHFLMMSWWTNSYIKFSFHRFREDEVRAEMGEREVQKLQKEVDKLEVNFDFGSA